jgi:hypothetical protein
MSRGVQIFRQTDVRKAAIAVRDAGLEVRRVEIDRAGKIVIVTGAPSGEPKPEDVAGLI